MIQIAICDDNPKDIDRIHALLDECEAFEGKYEVTLFENGEKLLLSEKRPFDLLFLDVQMPGLDGYETALKIRETDQDTVLVFLTGVAAPTTDVFRVTPFRYLMKQMGSEQIEGELVAILNEVNRKNQFISIRSGTDLLRIKISGILYMTIASRTVDLVTDNGVQNVKQKIGILYDELAPHGFGYSHKSYLINFNRVLSVQNNTVIMENGDILPISQPKAKSFRQEFVRFAGMKL